MPAFRTISLCICLGVMATAYPAGVQAQFTLRGPGVDPNDFRVTTFATGLNFPVGMAELDDGSVLVAVSNGTSLFGSTSGSLIRLADTDGDGVADQRTTVVNNVPGGGLSALRIAGDLVFTTGQGRGKPISVYRMGATPTDPFTAVGSLTINYPSGSWLHPHSALATRESPNQPGAYELYFQLGSRENFAVTTATATLSSTLGVSGTLAGDAIHRVTLVDNGTSVTASALTQVASGLRNAAGFAFHPTTGDFYFEDNGIDGLIDANEPHSADELNRIEASSLGAGTANFGFPMTYNEYRTNTVIGNTGIQPLVAFQPIAGDEGEGPNDIAFAPERFPAALQQGVFVGMHGKFSAGGIANEENPLVFVDLADNSYFYFVGNNESQVGHLDGLLSTRDSLFVSDLSPTGGLNSASASTGRIYQIKSLILPGDFDADGAYSCADIDALTLAIASHSSDLDFDLTDDGTIDLLDRDAWLAEAGSQLSSDGSSISAGDANLDGQVDDLDFEIWNAGRFTASAAWCQGDFQADGHIDVSDFNLWLQHRSAADGAASQVVPEPSGLFSMVLTMSWLGVFGRRRKGPGE